MKHIFYCLLLIFPLWGMAQKTVTINPDRGTRGNMLTVSLTGVNTNFTAGSNTINFFYQGSPTNWVQAQSSGVFSATQMQANLFISGSATLGAYTYKVNNTTDLQINGTQPFYVIPDTGGVARITSVTPGVITRNAPLRVTVTGYQTQFTQGSASLYFMKQGSSSIHVYTSNLLIVNDTQLTADVFATMAADTGFYGAFVGNGSTIWAKADALWVVDGPIGITEREPAAAVKVYPNPAGKEIHIQGNAAIEKAEITDLQGRLMQTETPPAPRPELHLQIYDAVLPNAWYLLRIYTQNGVLVRKIRIE